MRRNSTRSLMVFNQSPRTTSSASALFSVVLVALASMQLSAEVVKYEVSLDSLWNAQTHPVDYPENAHYSAHVGATHNENYSLWAPGAMSSPGMTTLAELGLPSPTNSEVEAAIEAGHADQFIQMPAVAVGETNRTFRVSDSHSMISMATMIAPSPDWFIGFHDVQLIDDDGNWIEQQSLDAWPYDAGTDSGVTYRSSNEVTDPLEAISRIEVAPLEGTPRFGVYTITQASIPGDVNESGAVDESDIRTICQNLGDADPRYEYTGDDMISVADVESFVEMRLGTRMGDTNLDGAVNFDDFLNLSQNFGREFRDWARGDFDCDQTVGFEDFLFLSENFGFEAETATSGEELAAVPEPSSMLLVLTTLGLAGFIRRRQR